MGFGNFFPFSMYAFLTNQTTHFISVPQWWENIAVFRSLRSVVIVAAVFATVAFGQTTVRITGKVTDRVHRPIANAAVVLKIPGSTETVAATTTDQNGSFTFRAETPGGYDLHFHRDAHG
jgi:hypothetical protein